MGHAAASLQGERLQPDRRHPRSVAAPIAPSIPQVAATGPRRALPHLPHGGRSPRAASVRHPIGVLGGAPVPTILASVIVLSAPQPRLVIAAGTLIDGRGSVLYN